MNSRNFFFKNNSILEYLRLSKLIFINIECNFRDFLFHRQKT